MRRRIIIPAIVAALAVFAAGGLRGEDKPLIDTIKIAEKEGVDPGAKFASYYKPVKFSADAKIPAYKLPLDLDKVANFKAFSGKIKLDEKALALLKQNGFVVVPFLDPKCDSITEPYNSLKKRELPIFVTSDTLLHLYHIQFDETLKDIEEREFSPDLVAMTKAMYEASLSTYNHIIEVTKKALITEEGAQEREAWKRNAIFFAVALSLLEQPREITTDSVKKMSQEDFEAFLKQMQSVSNSKEVAEAATRLMYSGERDEKNVKILVDAYADAVSKGAIKADKPTALPDWVKAEVDKEREFIDKHDGFHKSPLFNYEEDYSQYVPRGHYTRTFVLKKYFKAMMWYGRLVFLIDGSTDVFKQMSAAEAEREAKIQTIQASLIAGIASELKAGERTVAESWNRIYAVTAYYVGLSDDLTLYDYRAEMRKVFGGEFKAFDLVDNNKWAAYRKNLGLLPPPLIYSGTGRLAIGDTPGKGDEETQKKACEITKGMRFMGQRYIPDSYIMGKLVYPTIGKPLEGAGECFTLVQTLLGPARGFPRGLDVMAVLGSDRALAILDAEDDSKYENYDNKMKDLRAEFAKYGAEEWNRNLYWSWVYALKALIEPPGEGTQSFMRTDAWLDKQLNAALASWAELRHDTILYAKQSYTLASEGVVQPPKLVEGYVEPVPEFYARLLAMTQMTTRGLDDMKVLDANAKARLEALETILKELLDISVKELANEKLTEKEYDFIRNFGARLEGAISKVATQGKETTIVADVHTDQNSRQVLEEGVGYVKMIVVAYVMPDGTLVIGAGPVLSYYEFKQPLAERLTDEAWKGMLKDGKAPARQKWAGSFSPQE